MVNITDNINMNILITITTLFSFASYAYEFDAKYDSTGWSGKLLSDKEAYQKSLYQCAKNEGLSRNNFVSHKSAIGFSSKMNGKKGISFLTSEGDYKFISWDQLPKDKDKAYFKLGNYTFLGEKTKNGTWFFDDYLSSKINTDQYALIPTFSDKLNEEIEGQLFGETAKSVRILNQNRDNYKINNFSTSLIDCLKVAKYNKDKNFLTSLDDSSSLMSIVNKNEIATEFETNKKNLGLGNLSK